MQVLGDGISLYPLGFLGRHYWTHQLQWHIHLINLRSLFIQAFPGNCQRRKNFIQSRQLPLIASHALVLRGSNAEKMMPRLIDDKGLTVVRSPLFPLRISIVLDEIP